MFKASTGGFIAVIQMLNLKTWFIVICENYHSLHFSYSKHSKTIYGLITEAELAMLSQRVLVVILINIMTSV